LRTIVFVTGNTGKLAEARAKLGPLGFDVTQDKGGYPELQCDSLEEVAKEGVRAVAGRLDCDFILEDAGLFVDALHGFPGVYSAYVNKTLGCEGLLKLMDGTPENGRAARFEAVIAYYEKGTLKLFKGVCHGRISDSMRGGGGFGFDPVFVPTGDDRSFAEMCKNEKNAASHRGRAFDQFVEYLKNGQSGH